MKIQVLWGLLGSLLLSCSSKIVEPSINIKQQELSEAQKEADQNKQTAEDMDTQASEPVPIGGGYLICAYVSPEKSTIGCRLEDEMKQKIMIADLRNDDVVALSPESNKLAVEFQPAAQSNFWHWISASQLANIIVSKVTLSKRFILNSEIGYISEILDSYPSETIATPPAQNEAATPPRVIPPPPGGGQITRVAENKVRAGDYFWYYGPLEQSCTETCAANGGVNQEITVEWSKSVGFCTNVVTRVFGLAISPVSDVLDDNLGLGCFTVQGSIPTVYTERNKAPVNVDAKKAGVRRLCSCQL